MLNQINQVQFITYFGKSIKSNLPDYIFGEILSYFDNNAYELIIKLNTYLRHISSEDLEYLLHVEDSLYINYYELHCFINIMNLMPLMYESSKGKMINGQECKHRIEHYFGYGVLYWYNYKKDYYYKDFYISGKLKLTFGYNHYVDRLSTVLAFILSGFKRNGREFQIKEIRYTKKTILKNKHLLICCPR
jgi:hypothetical protein